MLLIFHLSQSQSIKLDCMLFQREGVVFRQRLEGSFVDLAVQPSLPITSTASNLSVCV